MRSLLAQLALTVTTLSATTLPALAQEKGVMIKQGKDSLEFMSGDTLVTKYHTSGFAKPIFYPLYAPNGVGLTRNWQIVKDVPGEATDHPHQKSAWFCHGDVIPEGLELKDKIKGVVGVDF